MREALKRQWLLVAARRLLIRGTAHRQRWEDLRSLRDPNLNADTHCSECCLPLGNHVEHEVPDIPRPREVTSPSDPAWRKWHKAFTTRYRTVLESLTDEELLAMPLPTHGIRLWVIGVELERRVNRPRPVAPTAWERIMGDSVV